MFHGTFVFDFHDDDLDVLIPEVEGHVYRAGSWLGETELICGEDHDHGAGKHEGPDTYTLSGVEDGSVSTLPLEHNLMLHETLVKDVDSRLYAKIRMPLPDRITTPRRGHLENNAENFEHAELLPKDYQDYLGTLQIFTYRFERDNALRLSCHPEHTLWEPAFSGGAVTLHLFAAPEHLHLMPPLNERKSHVQDAFLKCMELFEDMPLRIAKLPTNNEFDPADVPSGAIPEETEDLAPRIRRFAQLGRMRKDERDLNLVWFPSDAYDGDPGGCSSCGNRG